MSTLGHLAVAAAAGRYSRPADRRAGRRWTLWLAVVAIAADFDFIGVWFFGVAPGSPWYHRGITHAMLPSILGGILSVAVARRLGVDPRLGWAIGTLVAATHPLLDGLSLESAGLPLWWPLDREFWQSPVKVFPGVLTTTDYLTLHGLGMLGLEVVIFSPLAWYGCRPGRRRGGDEKNTGGP